jgi:hypothetical protein
MQPLMTLPLDRYRSILPDGMDHASAHRALVALLTETLDEEVAGFFAPVSPSQQDLNFFAPQGRVARFAELDATGRNRLRAEIGRIISEARRGAELAAAENPTGSDHLTALLAAAIEIPSFEQVFAHEGRPVLAGWGMAPANAPGGLGLLRDLDDGKPAEAPARAPLAALGAALLALFLLGAVAAFAAPWIARWMAPEPGMCRVDPGDIEAMNTLLREREREGELRNRLASLQQELGRRRAECALPEPSPPPPPPPPAPEPTPPPSPPPPLPAERWNRGDLGMLEGCWVLGAETQSRYNHNGVQELCRVSAGKICFDRSGRGTRESVMNCPSVSRITCNAPVTAVFQGSTLSITQPQVTCTPGSVVWHPDTLTCTRSGNDLARCVDRTGFTHDFHREGGRR